jgi:hypothetical protein
MARRVAQPGQRAARPTSPGREVRPRDNLFLFRQQNVLQSKIASHAPRIDAYEVAALRIETPLGERKTASPIHKSGQKMPLHQGVGATSARNCTRGGGPERDNV